MKHKRKKTARFRLNGHPSFHAGSIHSVSMAELEARIKEFEAKLANPCDPDDRKWTARWLERLRKELEKKRAGRSLKQREKQDWGRSRRS
jgi:hypothetical protein